MMQGTVVVEGIDTEFAAIVEVMAALDKLNSRSRVRVIAYVLDRLAIAEPVIRIDQATAAEERRVGKYGARALD